MGALKNRRFREEQIEKMLCEEDRSPVAKLTMKHGANEQSLQVWRQLYGASDVTDVKILRDAERDSARLKKLVAERVFEIGR